MTGIYKITSPSGYIYIGQSINLEKRLIQYAGTKKVKSQPLIQRSIIKHGWSEHIFTVIHDLPEDITPSMLTHYEQIYMDLYKDCGVVMLNTCPAAGSRKGAKNPPEQVAKHALFMKGKPSPMKGKTHSNESRGKIKARRALQTNVGGKWSDSAKKKISELRKGKVSRAPGFKVSEETKEKLRLANLGKKLSPETIRKREETRRKNGNNKGWSEEARKRRSELYKGRPSPQKGKTLSDYQIKRIKETHTGRKQSIEERLRRSEALKKYWANKKNL